MISVLKTLKSIHCGQDLESNSGKIGLNIFGTIQPEVLQEFCSEKVTDPDGYWSRFLYCYQPKTKKEIELKRTGEPSPLPKLPESLFRAVYALPAISYELCDKGYETYAVYYNFLAATGHNEVHPAMSKAYSKALGLTGRLDPYSAYYRASDLLQRVNPSKSSSIRHCYEGNQLDGIFHRTANSTTQKTL